MNYDLESIVIKVKANSSGDLIIPLKGFSNNRTTDCPYDWKISVDNGAETTYTGTGGGILTIGSGLTAGSEHLVIIKPTTVDYQWARAFGTNGGDEAQYITEIVQDASYIGFAISATNTGNSYRAWMFQNSPITQTVPEVLPYGVTTIGSYYYAGYYYGTLITTPEEEVMPDSVTTIGDYFRYAQYRKCAALTITAEEVLPNSVTTIGNYFRPYQYAYCPGLISSANEVLSNSITTIGNYFRAYQYYQCTGLVSGAPEVLPNSVTTIGNYFRSYQYGGSDDVLVNIVNIPDEVMPDSVTTIGNYFRVGMYYRCVKLEKAAKEAFSTNVTSIGTYFRPYEYYGCISLTTASEEAFDCKVVNIPNYFRYRTYHMCESLKTPVKEVLPNNITTIGDYFRSYQYNNCKSIKTPAVEYLPDSVTTIGDDYRRMMYSYSGVTKTAVEYVPPHLTTVGGFYRDQQYLFCESLTEIVKEADLPGVTVGNGFRVSQYRSCPSITKAKLAAFTGTFLGNNRNLMFTDSLSTNTPITITIIGHAFEKPQASLGITNDAVVDKIYVDSNFLQQYKSSSNWSAISDDKFVGISTASVTAGILVGYKPDSGVDKQLILAGSTLELCPRRVLTGTENRVWDSTNNRVYMTITQDTTSWYGASSTHGPCKESSSDTTRDDGRCTDNKKLCCYTTKNSLQEFKDWLAQEYADGTPVIVINYNGAFNTRTGEPQDINVMDGENIIEVISTAASKPEDIKLEATVGLDTGNYSAYVLSDVDYTDINNWIKVSETKDTEGFVTKGELSNVALSGDYKDLENTPDLTQYVDKESNETITGKKNFNGGFSVISTSSAIGLGTANNDINISAIGGDVNISSPIAQGVTQGNVVIHDLITPTANNDAATKGYVDNAINISGNIYLSNLASGVYKSAGATYKVLSTSTDSININYPHSLYFNYSADDTQFFTIIGHPDGEEDIHFIQYSYSIPDDYLELINDLSYYHIGDMQYSDFSFSSPTGSNIELRLSTEIEPSANFTVNAPSEVKEGIAYILRVTNGATPVTMTLGTGIVNPSSVDLTLTANAIDQFSFLGLSDGTLELQPGGSGSGDMKYKDFEFTSKSGASVVLDLSSTITPTSNFTVNVPTEIKEGQIYVLRVTNGATSYTMTLGEGITNPRGTSLSLTANVTDQFVFYAVSNSVLELQAEGGGSGGPENVFVTQDEYDALTPEAGKTYFIYEEEN